MSPVRVGNQRVVLVVDDNRLYRQAMARNLEFAGYVVLEAANGTEALASLAQQGPQVVITDLDMQTRTEGLDLIRQVKAAHPQVPVIMISAVGTFDEGALAQQYGAFKVLSKSRIDEEISTLYDALDLIYATLKRLDELREQVETCSEDSASAALRDELRGLLARTDLDPGMKSVAFDLLAQLGRPPAEEQGLRFSDDVLASAEQRLVQAIPCYTQLHSETRSMMRAAEVMFLARDDRNDTALARNMGFSYSFAVENEVKQVLLRRITKLLGSPELPDLLDKLYDRSLGNLELGFNQYMIRMESSMGPELNADIARQVLERMRQHGARYKPDGLKALGVIVFCFGREYSFRSLKGTVQIRNPMGLRGIPNDQLVQFAYSLVLLQHLRNPYIHPEFTEREKIERIREAAINCLNFIAQVA